MSERRAKLDFDDLPTAVRFISGNFYHLECHDDVTACGIEFGLERVEDGRELGQLCRKDMCLRCLKHKAFKALNPASIGWEQ